MVRLIAGLTWMLLVAVCHGSAQAADLTWVRAMGGTGGDLAYGIAVNSDGDAITTGVFAGTVDFDPGPGLTTLTAPGSSAVFVSKLDMNGDFVWAKMIAGPTGPAVRDVAVDESGNVYVVGSFSANADFDPGPETFILTSAGLSDAWVAKLDAAGDFVWALRWGGSSNDSADTVTVAGGLVRVGGNFQNTVDFDPGPGTTNLASAGSVDAYVSSFTDAGAFEWARRFGGSFVDLTTRLDTDADGAVVILGNFQGVVDFDPGPAVFNMTSAGDFDVFVSKLASDSTFIWAQRLGGFTTDLSTGLVVDGAGRVHVGGYFGGTADFDPGAGVVNLTSAGSADAFVVQLDANGDYAWAQRIGGSGLDLGLSIAVVPDGRVYAGGRFESTVDFDPGPDTDNRTAAGNQPDAFISEFDGLGGYLDAYIFTGSGYEDVTALASDTASQIYAAGTFSGSPDIDPGPGTSIVYSSGSTDSYVARLGSAGAAIPDIESIEIGNTATRNAGSTATVYAFEVSVIGDPNLIDVTLTPPAGLPIPLPFDALQGTFFLEAAGYPSLAALRSNFPLGDYRLDFNGGSSSVYLGYPDLTPECFAEVVFPAPGCVVSSTPTFAWDLPTGCAAGAIDIGLDIAATDDELFGLSFIPASGGSFAYPDGPIVPSPFDPPPPLSPLTVGETYRLGLDVVEGWAGMEFVNSDPFDYYASFRNELDTTFSVSDAGPILEIVLEADGIAWTCSQPAATGFDVVRGDLQTLRTGGFASATVSCVADDHPGSSLSPTGSPPPGSVWWYLVREVTANGTGSYSSGAPSELTGRDAGIAASGADCPQG